MLTRRSAKQRGSRGQPAMEAVTPEPARREPGWVGGAAANRASLPQSSLPQSSLRRAVCSGMSSDGGSAASSATSGRHPCALVVDDDPEICRALARCLKPELDVHLAGSVGEAEAALAGLARVDLAFVDWELPDGSGERILEQLARWPDSIRVLISGRLVPHDTVSNENPLRNRALANLVLSKPLAFHVVEALKRATLGLPND